MKLCRQLKTSINKNCSRKLTSTIGKLKPTNVKPKSSTSTTSKTETITITITKYVAWLPPWLAESSFYLLTMNSESKLHNNYSKSFIIWVSSTLVKTFKPHKKSPYLLSAEDGFLFFYVHWSMLKQWKSRWPLLSKAMSESVPRLSLNLPFWSLNN